MEKRTTFRRTNHIISIVCAIILIGFPTATLWGDAKPSPSENQEIVSKIKRLNEIVETFLHAGQFDRAEKFAKKAKEIAENHLGPYDPEFAVALDNLADFHWARKEFLSAAPLYLQALNIKEKNLGPEHPLLEPTLNRLLEFHQLREEFDQIQPFLLKLVKIKQNTLGPYDPGLIPIIKRIAGIYRTQDDHSRLQPALE